MKLARFVFPLALLFLLVTAAKPAVAGTLTFEDLGPNASSNVPAGYGGFNWNNIYVMNGPNSQAGYVTGTIGNYSIYNGFGDDASITDATSGATFTLNSAYFTAAWEDDNYITITGYLGGNAVDSLTFLTITENPVLENFGWAGIDTLTIHSSVDSQVVIDNMSVDDSIVTPEPSTLSLFAIGLVGLFAVSFRKRANSF